MSEGVRVESIDALRHMRIALFKFAEATNTALNDAESEMRNMLNWLENEQYSHWQSQIRNRNDLLQRAQEALRMKQVFKDSSGRTPTAVEEQKAVQVAKMRLEEAEQKFVTVKKYTRVLMKEIDAYKGSVQRLATTIQVDIPQAAATLDGLLTSLENYVMLDPSGRDVAPPPQTSPQEPPAQG
ncbi:MAG TPA: hypothetical protein VHD56_14660 [Tepidisphaeraceae bacterium]|nr:hypothetical protein [Tepidisphaeraceae bacterium]